LADLVNICERAFFHYQPSLSNSGLMLTLLCHSDCSCTAQLLGFPSGQQTPGHHGKVPGFEVSGRCKRFHRVAERIYDVIMDSHRKMRQLCDLVRP
jgi:hypothetical protein